MSVQELAKEPMLTIPQHYICADQEPSTLSHGTSLHMTPTLDMEQLLMGEATDLELDKLHSICKEWGIFQVFISPSFSLYFCLLLSITENQMAFWVFT